MGFAMEGHLGADDRRVVDKQIRAGRTPAALPDTHRHRCGRRLLRIESPALPLTPNGAMRNERRAGISGQGPAAGDDGLFLSFSRRPASPLTRRRARSLPLSPRSPLRPKTGFRQYLIRASRGRLHAERDTGRHSARLPALGLTKIVWAVDILLSMDIPGLPSPSIFDGAACVARTPADGQDCRRPGDPRRGRRAQSLHLPRQRRNQKSTTPAVRTRPPTSRTSRSKGSSSPAQSTNGRSTSRPGVWRKGNRPLEQFRPRSNMASSTRGGRKAGVDRIHRIKKQIQIRA